MTKRNPFYQTQAMKRRMIERRKVTRAPAVTAPANWDTMTEAEREAWRRAEEERSDMEELANLLFAG